MGNGWRRTEGISLCALMILTVLAAFLCGCNTVTDYTTYQNEDFTAELSGELNGVPFVAVIAASNGGREMSVAYLSSDSLAGIIVETHADGTATVTRGEISIPCDRSTVLGLLSPVSLLFDIGELQAVRKEGERTNLSFDGGGEMILSSEFRPLRVDFGDLSYEVVWWETSKNEQTG